MPAAIRLELRRDYAYVVSSAPSPTLSAAQLETLAELGEERTADVGDVLYRVGDRRYPFIAIIEGEVAILDAAGNEIVRHGASGFLGELNLLSGQTVFVTAVVTQPLRYIEVDRDALRPLLFEDGPLSDLLLSTFIARREALQQVEGVGIEVVGPRSSAATMRMRRVRSEQSRCRTPGATRSGPDDPDDSRAGRRARRQRACRSCACPAAWSLRGPTPGQVSRALGIGRELAPREEVDLRRRGRAAPQASARRSTARPRASTRSSSTSTALGGQAGSSRRIENYLGFPAGISGSELTSRAVTQAREVQRPPGVAVPRAVARAGQRSATSSASRTITRSRHARCCSRPARSTGACPSTDSPTTRA